MSQAAHTHTHTSGKSSCENLLATGVLLTSAVSLHEIHTMTPLRRQFAPPHPRSELVSHQHLNHLLITSGSQGRYSSELDALQQHSGDFAGREGGNG